MDITKKSIPTRPEILLCPNVPKPLHGLNPRTILGDKWWNKIRQDVYAKNNFHCFACGISKYDAKYHTWLEAHELYQYSYALGRAEMVEIVALCHSCHNYIHSGRLEMEFVNGNIDINKFTDVLIRGCLILISNNLPINSFAFSVMERNNINLPDSIKNYAVQETISGHTADWSDWRLILDGKEYKPIHKSFSAWREFYKNG